MAQAKAKHPLITEWWTHYTETANLLSSNDIKLIIKDGTDEIKISDRNLLFLCKHSMYIHGRIANALALGNHMIVIDIQALKVPRSLIMYLSWHGVGLPNSAKHLTQLTIPTLLGAGHMLMCNQILLLQILYLAPCHTDLQWFQAAHLANLYDFEILFAYIVTQKLNIAPHDYFSMEHTYIRGNLKSLKKTLASHRKLPIKHEMNPGHFPRCCLLCNKQELIDDSNWYMCTLEHQSTTKAFNKCPCWACSYRLTHDIVKHLDKIIRALKNLEI